MDKVAGGACGYVESIFNCAQNINVFLKYEPYKVDKKIV